MTNKEAGYIIGTLNDNDEYDICKIQEAKGKAIDLLWRLSEEFTNGEVIKALFPSAEVFEADVYGYEYVYVTVDKSSSSWKIQREWWDAPYKEIEDGTYAIASLKTDEAYELEYEEREVIPKETIDKILHQLQASDGKEEYISVKKCEEIIERIMKEEKPCLI